MKPLLWLAAGGAAAAGIYLLARKSTVVSSTVVSSPPPTYGEAVKVTLPVPAGWRRLGATETPPPEAVAVANALRAQPGFTTMAYNTLAPFQVDGLGTYATWIEQHYHPPGGAAKPWGYHHGVTILAQSTPGMLLDQWWF